MFFFADERFFQGSDIVILNNRVNMEDGTGNVNYKYFLENYRACRILDKQYIVLQGHPNQWDDKKMNEFVMILNFLQEEGCEFVLPSQISLQNK